MRIVKNLLSEYFFPINRLSQTDWTADWIAHEKFAFKRTMLAVMPLIAIVYVVHFHTIEHSLGVKPGTIWYALRYSSAAAALLCFACYLVPKISDHEYHKLPAAVTVTFLTITQALVVVVHPDVPFLFAYLFLIVAVLLLRLSPINAILYSILVLAVLWAVFALIGFQNVFMTSASVVTIFAVLITRVSVSENVNRFISEKSLFDIQKKTAEAQLQVTERLAKTMAQVAHDIRSPVSALKMVLREVAGLEDENRDLLQRTIQRITSVADELLLIHKTNLYATQKATSAIEKTTKHKFVLSKVIHQSLIEKRIEVSKSCQVELIEKLLPHAEIETTLSDHALARILSNLMNNSLTATERGYVRVELRQYGQWYIIAITDNGTGISKDLLQSIGQYGVTHTGGNGVGLFHAQNTLAKCGSRLRLFSRFGEGTMAVIRLRNSRQETS